jgi:hypothetical protein
MCNYCGETDGCRFTKGRITDAPLSRDDWNEIYLFMRYSYLPFIHAIIARAYRRNDGRTFTKAGRPRKAEGWLKT